MDHHPNEVNEYKRMNIRLSMFLILMMVLVFAPVSSLAASDSADVSELEARVQRLVLAWLDETGADPHQLDVALQLPGRQIIDAGLLIDAAWDASVDEQGLKVLGTTPSGAAARMGVQRGDRLLAANARSLLALGADQDGRARAAEVLADALEKHQSESAESEPSLSLTLLRDGREQHLHGALKRRWLPAVQVNMGLSASMPALLASATESADSPGCGEISIFRVPPEARSIYPVRIATLNGDHRAIARRQTVRVPAGTYTLELVEYISEPGFRTVGQNRGRPKPLSVTVEPDRVYEIGAQFNRDKRYRGVTGEYWDPVVWSERERQCTRVDLVPEPLH